MTMRPFVWSTQGRYSSGSSRRRCCFSYPSRNLLCAHERATAVTKRTGRRTRMYMLQEVCGSRVSTRLAYWRWTVYLSRGGSRIRSPQEGDSGVSVELGPRFQPPSKQAVVAVRGQVPFLAFLDQSGTVEFLHRLLKLVVVCGDARGVSGDGHPERPVYRVEEEILFGATEKEQRLLTDTIPTSPGPWQQTNARHAGTRRSRCSSTVASLRRSDV
ncbi:hypothetical protein PV04_09800 [Phialophora macrospora]|uniref:Uncharacterized protein n=1 Tax=Phialophora macrospora TaxID=1851006 RepID=A0A0D2DKI4_9EURO|nr:hypothetical protein PV04_09800 [Phialophora macrospora]